MFKYKLSDNNKLMSIYSVIIISYNKRSNELVLVDLIDNSSLFINIIFGIWLFGQTSSHLYLENLLQSCATFLLSRNVVCVVCAPFKWKINCEKRSVKIFKSEHTFWSNEAALEITFFSFFCLFVCLFPKMFPTCWAFLNTYL